MARKTWQTAADWQTGIAENLEITDAGVKLARPEPAQFTRASEAYLSDGTLVAANQPRYTGAGVRVEPGTTNLIPLAKQKFEGWAAYQGAVVTLTQGIAVPEWGATDATRIQTSGGTDALKYLLNVETPPAGALRAEQIYIKNTGTTTVQTYPSLQGIRVDILPGESKLVKMENIIGNGSSLLQFQFLALDVADSLDFIAWRPMVEAKPYCTSWTDGTRAPETLSVPVLFEREGEVEFNVDVNDACKRQATGEYPRLLHMTRANGNRGLTLHHSQIAAAYQLRTDDDTGANTSVDFADSLIPNGTRTLKISITTSAVILYCDGVEIARIDNPALPSAWGRIWLGSSATGTNHADASFGNLRLEVA
jgi:hypothetical protein